MKLKYAISVMVIIPLIILLTTISIYKDYSIPKEKFSFEFEVTIKENAAGFNLDEDKVYFGEIDKRATSHRNAKFVNNNLYKIRLEYLLVSHEGVHFNDWFQINPLAGGIVDPNETIQIDFRLIPPNYAEYKIYKGEIVVLVFKAKPWEEGRTIYRELEGCFSKKIWDIIYCKPQTN